MSELFDISGKIAIVTGASRGIGQAIAERMAEAGAKVVISSRKLDGLEAVAAGIRAKGGDATPVAAHNGDREALHNLVARTVEVYGGLDILVNNAATNPHFGPILDAQDSMWQKTIEVNLMGNFWLTQAAVVEMRKRGGGKIVNVASIVGIRPGAFQGIYSVTKAGVISLTRTLGVELAGDNIQVNAIAPGLVKTKFAEAIWSNEVLHNEVLKRTPQGRMGEPDDIAGLAVFLASPAANFITAQVFTADGGLTALTF